VPGVGSIPRGVPRGVTVNPKAEDARAAADAGIADARPAPGERRRCPFTTTDISHAVFSHLLSSRQAIAQWTPWSKILSELA